MLDILRSEMFRALRRWPTGLAFLLVVGFLLQGMVMYALGDSIVPYASAYMAFLIAIDGPSGFWLPVLPLAACLVAGDSLAWDRRTGFIRLMLTHVPRRTYILGKLLSVTLLTGIVVFAGLLLSFLLACIWFPLSLPPWQVINGTATFIFPNAPGHYIYPWPGFLHNFLFAHPFLYVLVVSSIGTLSAMTWANVALLISLWSTRIYLVLGGPWLVYVGLVFVLATANLFVNLPLTDYLPTVLSGGFIGHLRDRPEYEIPLIWVCSILLVSLTVYTVFIRRSDVLELRRILLPRGPSKPPGW